MQTFLPYPCFEKSVTCLDWRRLGKQRVECLQILKALDSRKGGWVNHPATRMWMGYSDALENYLWHCITEWVGRGYKNSMLVPVWRENAPMPPWFGDPAFHAAHRSNLLRKDAKHYGQFGWTEPHDLEYIWPVQ